MLFHELFHLAVLGHEGFVVVLSPWGLLCSYIVLPSFHYLITCLLHVLFDFSGPCVLYDCFLPYARVYPCSCVSSHSLWRQVWLWACICLQRHGFLVLGKVPSLIYKAPWPPLQPVPHHLFHICSMSEQAYDARSSHFLSVFKILRRDLFPYSCRAGEKTCSIIICSSLRKWERKEGIRVLRLTEELDLPVTVLSGFPHLSNHDAYTKVNNDVCCCRKASVL